MNDIQELVNWSQYEHRRRNIVKSKIISAVTERIIRRKCTWLIESNRISKRGAAELLSSGSVKL